ncbi:MAG: FkbM family methyltransferase [Acidobacteriota bacterium]
MQAAQQENRTEDIQQLEAAIAGGETCELWNDWATLQCGSGNLQEAERGYRRAIELDPSERQPAVNLGLILFAQGRLADALPLLDRHRNTLTDEERKAILQIANHIKSQMPAAAVGLQGSWLAVADLDRFAEFPTRTIVTLTEAEGPSFSMPEGWQGFVAGSARAKAGVKLVTGEVSADSVVSLLRRHEIVSEFDLLVIENAFHGFHQLRGVLTGFRPRVAIVPYNASLGSEADQVVPHLRGARWDGTRYYGASYRAFCRLAERYGYTPVLCTGDGTKLVLVRKDCLKLSETPLADSLFREGPARPADPANRPWLTSAHYLIDGVGILLSKYGSISFFENDEYIGQTLASGEYWDAALMEQVGPLLAKLSGAALDIGAHVGCHSIAMARYAPGLHFTCFEPQLPLFRLLERNIHENGLGERIQPIWGAVGPKSGTITLSGSASDGTSAGQSFAYGKGAPVNLGGIQIGAGGQECPLHRIDDIEAIRTASLVYVKMDVEGAEPLVLQGMEQTLRRNRPIFLYEERDDRQLPAEALEALHVAPEQLFSVTGFLQARGYQIHTVALDCLAVPGAQAIEAAPKIAASAVDARTAAIPARIFQTWKNKTLPAPWDTWSKTFQAKNPGFAWELWDDSDNRNFIATEFPWFLKTYDAYAAEIYRADVVRYFYLYLRGGIYADLDTECLRPLDPLLTRADVLLGRMGPNESFAHSIPNAIMASKPRQEFWLFVVSMLMQFSQYQDRPETLTGPVLLKSAYDLYTVQDPVWAGAAIQRIRGLLRPDQQPLQGRSQIELLGSRQWFPLDWSDPLHQLLRTSVLRGQLLDDTAKAALFPESWMVTWWSHSWEKGPHNPVQGE